MSRVLVLGSSNTDMTVRLPRLPTPGQTVLGGSLVTGPGGKGANQAVAAARAGGTVVFVTAVGDDPLGLQALDGYRREGIDVTHATAHSGVASGVALILVGEDGENMIGVAPGANDMLTASAIDRLPDELFRPDRLLLIAGLEVPLDSVARAVRRGAEAGMTIVLNPAPVSDGLRGAGFLHLVDLITPNRVELGQLTGMSTDADQGVLDAAVALTREGPRSAAVTIGARGCLVLDDRGHDFLPSFPVRAVDTVGAGDAFNGAFCVALASGRSLRDAASWANAAAALSVTHPGAQSALPFREAIDRLAFGPAS